MYPRPYWTAAPVDYGQAYYGHVPMQWPSDSAALSPVRVGACPSCRTPLVGQAVSNGGGVDWTNCIVGGLVGAILGVVIGRAIG